MNPERNYWGELNPEFQSGLERGDMDRSAEAMVMNFYQTSFSNAEVRPATLQEDAAIGFGYGGKAIDAVMYLDGRPALVLQITATLSEERRNKKIKEMTEHPFMRLNEMKPNDPAIPRALIWLSPEQVNRFTADPDFSHQKDAALQILNSTELSLMFNLRKTQNPKEKKHVSGLIELVQTEKQKFKSAPQELAA